MTNPFHKAARAIESLPDGCNSATAKRIRTEGRICGALVDAALAAGFTVSVHDGEAFALKRSSDAKAIVAAMFSTDEDSLILRDANGDRVGSFQLVYGNDGTDVINDYTANAACEAISNAIQPVIDKEEAAFA